MRIPGRQSKNGAYYGEGANKLRALYKGRTVQVFESGFFPTLAKLRELQQNGMDVSPFFMEVIKEFTEEQRARFDTRTTPDTPPQRWVQLSKRYKKRKVKMGGRRVANLILTGRLRDAVFGGPGWYAEVNPTDAEWGIRDIPYAAAHQYGTKNMPARRFFLARNDQLPLGVKNRMVEIMTAHLKGDL